RPPGRALSLPAVALVRRHAGGAGRHDLGCLPPAAAWRSAAVSYHGGERARRDRLSFRRQRPPHRRPGPPPPNRVHPHAQGRCLTAMSVLAILLAAVFAACCVLLAAFVGSLLYMVVLHHRLKPQGLARERALLATPLPPDEELPHVVVQIPSFNEG